MAALAQTRSEDLLLAGRVESFEGLALPLLVAEVVPVVEVLVVLELGLGLDAGGVADGLARSRDAGACDLQTRVEDRIGEVATGRVA